MKSDAVIAQSGRLGEDGEKECLKKGAVISNLDLLFTRFILILPKPHKPPTHRHIGLLKLNTVSIYNPRMPQSAYASFFFPMFV